MKRNGHIIILRPDKDLEKYEASDFMQKNLHHLKTLRGILNFINPSKYRGSGREHFAPFPYFINDKGQLEVFQDSKLSNYNSLEARKKLASFEEKNTAKNTLDDLCFYSLEEMTEVYELMEDKDNYEIIYFAELYEKIDDKTLGFDVGYLSADYSVIADTAIKPTWHPPDFDDMQDIIKHLKELNEHCLFPTLQQAEAFRNIYLTKNWGEKEMHERQITTIQIRSV